MRRIDTAANPSASAMRIAVAAISSRVKRGRRAGGLGAGPQVERARGARRARSSASACLRRLGSRLGARAVAPPSRRPSRQPTFSTTSSRSRPRLGASRGRSSLPFVQCTAKVVVPCTNKQYAIRTAARPVRRRPARRPSAGTARRRGHRASASASATCGPCATSTSTSRPAPCSACSATTARARPPPSASSPPSRSRPTGSATVAGIDVAHDPLAVRERIGVAAPAGHRRRADERAQEPRDGRPPAPPPEGARPAGAPTSCSSASTSPTRPTSW